MYLSQYPSQLGHQLKASASEGIAFTEAGTVVPQFLWTVDALKFDRGLDTTYQAEMHKI